MAAGGAETLIQFGISLVPATERLDRIRELVRAADEAALDLIGIQDHPYWPVDTAPGQVEMLARDVVPHVGRPG